MTRPGLRVLTASWPGKKEPWRARFIRDLHLDLAADFDTELIAPQVHREDLLEEQDGPFRSGVFDIGPAGNRRVIAGRVPSPLCPG